MSLGRTISSPPSDDYKRSPAMRRVLFALLLLLPVHAVRAEPLVVDPAGHSCACRRRARRSRQGQRYQPVLRDHRHGSPVVLLHGGLSNSDYWGNQIKALAPHHSVIVVDSRGHGRSTRDARPYGYDLMAELCLIRCTSPRPTWSAGATAPSLASTLPFAIQTASVRCLPSPPIPSRQACKRA